MAGEIYQASETARTWSDAGTTSDEDLDLGGLSATSARIGSYWDLGASPRADVYEVEVFIDGFDSAPTIGDSIDVYISQSSDASNFDGVPDSAPTDTADQALADTDAVANMTYVGSVLVKTTTAADNLLARFPVRLTSRYIAPCVVNNTAVALLSSSDAHIVTITPIPQQIQ